MTWEHVMQRDGWAVRTLTHTRMNCDATHFHLRARMQAFEDDTPVRDQTYSATIPRQSA